MYFVNLIIFSIVFTNKNRGGTLSPHPSKLRSENTPSKVRLRRSVLKSPKIIMSNTTEYKINVNTKEKLNLENNFFVC